jgi:hypothetical protein
MPFTRDKSFEKQVATARKLMRRLEEDSYYSMNSELCSFIGTITMWFTLC